MHRSKQPRWTTRRMISHQLLLAAPRSQGGCGLAPNNSRIGDPGRKAWTSLKSGFAFIYSNKATPLWPLARTPYPYPCPSPLHPSRPSGPPVSFSTVSSVLYPWYPPVFHLSIPRDLPCIMNKTHKAFPLHVPRQPSTTSHPLHAVVEASQKRNAQLPRLLLRPCSHNTAVLSHQPTLLFVSSVSGLASLWLGD